MIISPSAKNICHTCGVRYGTSIIPTICEICADDRQYIGFTGQVWTSYNELAAKSSIRFLRIFTFHQRKGGIHEIYRSFMDTFGWYRLAGVRSIKISAD